VRVAKIYTDEDGDVVVQLTDGTWQILSFEDDGDH